jgi:hypothetical protein
VLEPPLTVLEAKACPFKANVPDQMLEKEQSRFWGRSEQSRATREEVRWKIIHKNNINVYYVVDAATCNFSVYSEERAL